MDWLGGFVDAVKASVCGFFACGDDRNEAALSELQEIFAKMDQEIEGVSDRAKAFAERANLRQTAAQNTFPSLFENGDSGRARPGNTTGASDPRPRGSAQGYALGNGRGGKEASTSAVQSTNLPGSGCCRVFHAPIPPLEEAGFEPSNDNTVRPCVPRNRLCNTSKVQAGFPEAMFGALFGQERDGASPLFHSSNGPAALGENGRCGECLAVRSRKGEPGRCRALSKTELVQVTKRLLSCSRSEFEDAVVSCSQELCVDELDLLTLVSDFLDKLPTPHTLPAEPRGEICKEVPVETQANHTANEDVPDVVNEPQDSQAEKVGQTSVVDNGVGYRLPTCAMFGPKLRIPGGLLSPPPEWW